MGEILIYGFRKSELVLKLVNKNPFPEEDDINLASEGYFLNPRSDQASPTF